MDLCEQTGCTSQKINTRVSHGKNLIRSVIPLLSPTWKSNGTQLKEPMLQIDEEAFDEAVNIGYNFFSTGLSSFRSVFPIAMSNLVKHFFEYRNL